jgi:hypothetical protein
MSKAAYSETLFRYRRRRPFLSGVVFGDLSLGGTFPALFPAVLSESFRACENPIPHLV